MRVESWAGDRDMGLSIKALGLGEIAWEGAEREGAWDPNASNRIVDVGQRRVSQGVCTCV